MPAARRFLPPWIVEQHNNACFIVRDNNGHALGYFYFEDESAFFATCEFASIFNFGQMRRKFERPP